MIYIIISLAFICQFLTAIILYKLIKTCDSHREQLAGVIHMYTRLVGEIERNRCKMSDWPTTDSSVTLWRDE